MTFKIRVCVLAALLTGAGSVVSAQINIPSIINVLTDPSGTCASPGTPLQYNTQLNHLSACQGASPGPYSWALVSGGGGSAALPLLATGSYGTYASLPITCTTGQLYFATDKPGGVNIYECASTNTWTQQFGYVLPSASFSAVTGVVTLTESGGLAQGGSLFSVAITPTTPGISGITMSGVPAGNSLLIIQWTMGATPYPAPASAAPAGFNSWCAPIQTATIVTTAVYETLDGGTTFNMIGCTSNSGISYFGTDNVSAGNLQVANGGAAAHTTIKSAATTSNEVDFFATAPTTGDLVDVTTSGVIATLHDSGILTVNLATQASNGTSGGVPCYTGANKALVSSGALASANVVFGGGAGACPTTTAPSLITITTGTSATLSTAYTVNNEATAAQAVAYTLPTAAAATIDIPGFCVDNGSGAGGANTGILTVNTSASGQFIIFTDGTLSATGGNVTSAGAARDGACFIGIDATHWMMYSHNASGAVWVKH